MAKSRDAEIFHIKNIEDFSFLLEKNAFQIGLIIAQKVKIIYICDIILKSRAVWPFLDLLFKEYNYLSYA